MLKGINFKEIATKAAGHAAGAALYTQVNKLSFIKKLGQDAAGNPDPKKKAVQGLVIAALGYVAVPAIAKKMKLTGNKGGLVSSAFEGLGMVGIMQAANAQFPAKDGKPSLFPVISGVGGYEENPIMGLGNLYEDHDAEVEVSGYERNPYAANSPMEA